MAAMKSQTGPQKTDLSALKRRIVEWGRELGFQRLGVAGVDLSVDEGNLRRWLAEGRHGEMDYMARHGDKRTRPEKLKPGTVRVISARMDYYPERDPAGCEEAWSVLHDPAKGYLSRYALGRDYHKVMRKRLQKLADRIEGEIGSFGYRAFVDSAPVMEKPLARNAGLGWIGKHTNLLSTEVGSWFFLGELYTDLPLPVDEPGTDHCGSCRRCIDACPTGAITGPYELDARLCISYLTIELRGSIPEKLRPLVGNRVYGCDDCQLVCPWNKFARKTAQGDFSPRNDLDSPDLVWLFSWSEEEFYRRTEGSAIRRIGYECWLRNVAVALGNAETSDEVIRTLRSRENHPSALVREHVHWALTRHETRQDG